MVLIWANNWLIQHNSLNQDLRHLNWCLCASDPYPPPIFNVQYRIAGNFHLEKIFAFFAQAGCGRKFFGKLFYPVKILSHWNFVYVATKQY